MQQEQRPKVGVGVMIFKDGKVLLGKRKSSHGDGEYAWPGGHMEYMESFEECAKRETMEETGMQIRNVRFFASHESKTICAQALCRHRISRRLGKR
jgi:8-oxo-dGTP diphosphatase